MKKIFLSFSFVLFFACSFSQNTTALIKEGVNLHDRGFLEEAIMKYDSVLAIDKIHYVANYEKSFTLMELKQYEKSIEISKLLLKEHKNNESNAAVYINYGTCLDYLKKPEEAIEIYNKGIKAFPNSALLHFNKAITLINSNEVEDAIEATQYSLINNPYHASSHNIMGVVYAKNKIYSAFANMVFLIIEPYGKRAKENFQQLETSLNGNVKKTGENSVSINMDINAFVSNKKTPDNFSSIEMMMGLSQALNHSAEKKDETPQQKMKNTLSIIFSSLETNKKEGKGFSWKFYAPFFIELEEKNYTEVLAHIIYTCKEEPETARWLKENKEKVDEFYKWFKDYKWARPKI